jgi:thymidylate kinase
MIVVFSGIDSSGKTTQIALFENYCAKKGYNVRKIWGKGRGTPGVLLIKDIFRPDKHLSEDGKKEYRKKVYGSRKKKVLLLIASILDLYWYFGIYYRLLNLTHKILICDRYIWDTYIDFRSEFPEFDIDKWWIWMFALLLVPKSKHSFMFFISAEESYARDIAKGDKTLDPLDIKRVKVERYMNLINKNKWEVVIDGMQDRQTIFKTVISKVFPK